MKDDFILNLYQRSQTVFSLKEISLMFPSISYVNIKSRMSYYVKRRKLLRLRKSVYAKENYNTFELSSKLYVPSYISLETVLEKEGIIFQKYESIFAASYITRTIKIDNHEIIYRRLPEEVLLNKEGVFQKDNYYIASKERAFLDAVFLYKNYHFDNLKSLDWEKIMEFKQIYRNKAFEKRVNSYNHLYKTEYV